MPQIKSNFYVSTAHPYLISQCEDTGIKVGCSIRFGGFVWHVSVAELSCCLGASTD